MTTKKLNFIPSKEQEKFLKYLEKKYNIVGDCVAGSGKTTTCFFIANKFIDKKILLLTYNSHLKSEVRLKSIELGIENMEIHSYNSLVYKYYDDSGYDDSTMNNVIKNNVEPKTEIPNFHMVIIDESQDMTYLYYGFITKFLRDMKSKYKLIILGDKNQSIYKFKDSDQRFLTMSPQIWGKRTFANLTLSVSYRLTNPIGQFINEVMLGYERIKTVRDGPKVKYIVTDKIFAVYNYIAELVTKMIKEDNIPPDEIFILAFSIKSSSAPIKQLENKLVQNGIPLYYPTSDETKLDESIIRKKVVFSTFHQSKGRERKVTIIYGFDNTHFKFFETKANSNICPDTLYIAATRPKEQLVVIQSNEQGILQFLKKSEEEIQKLDYVEFINLGTNFNKNVNLKKFENIHKTSPTEIVRFLNDHTIKEIQPLIRQIFKTERKASYLVDLPSKVNFTEDKFEDVSDINGIVIPMLYEIEEYGSSSVINYVMNKQYNILTKSTNRFLQNAFLNLEKYKNNGLKYYIYITILYISMKENIFNKLSQITQYDWLKLEMVEECIQSLRNELNKEEKLNNETYFEYEIMYDSNDFSEFGKIFFHGFIDVVSHKHIYELKCTEVLSLDNYLQLVVYSWLWNNTIKNTLGSRIFKLLNIKTGEISILIDNPEIVDEIMYLLVKNKYQEKTNISDDQFLEMCANYNLHNTNRFQKFI